MGVEVVTDLTSLDPALVAQFDASLTELIQELNPAIDLKSGVYHDQVMHLMAILQAADQTNINLVLQSNSLLQATANPSLVDSTILANLLSNFNITPNPGVEATGSVTIVISKLIGTIIPAGSIFTINGLQYAPTATYAARTSPASVVAPTDVLITALGSNWAFTIPITAQAVGSVYNILQGSAATPSSNISNFVQAFAQNDFTGGQDASTNQELLTQLTAGLAIATWGNRQTINSLIIKQPAFANVENMSIIGFGDPEMIRDQHAIWPGSTGGRSDLYLRSQPLYQNVALNVTASLVSKNAGGEGTWQFGIGRNDAPGFYVVNRILLFGENPTDAGFPPSSDVRNFDITNVVDPPDIVNVIEAVYSRYQTAIIQFVDTVTDCTGIEVGTQVQYTAIVQLMPLVDQVQDFLLTRSVQPPLCDVLVKAPMPCFTTLSFTVNYVAGTTAPVVSTIQTAVAQAINDLDFPGSISGSFISQVLHNLYTNLVSITSMSLIGQLRLPNGSLVVINSTQAITIPNNYPEMLSGRTAAFFVEPGDIGVTLVAVDTPNV